MAKDPSQMTLDEINAELASFNKTKPIEEMSLDEINAELSSFAPKKPKSSATESAIMQGLQGATGGFLDELAGGFEAGGRAIGLKGLGGSFSDIGLAEGGPTLSLDELKKAYIEARGAKRGVLESQAKESPALSTAANIAGGIVSPINKLTKGMSLAKSGAALGGLYGLGESQADLTEGEALQALKDAATGVVTGAVIGKGIEKASPLLEKGAKKVKDAFSSKAEMLAARALGTERGTIKSIGADKVKKIGRYALEEGVVSPSAGTEKMVARNLAKQETGGKLMGEVYEEIDKRGIKKFNPLEVAAKVDEEIGNFYRSPLNRGETGQLENTLESILMRGEKDISLREAQRLKNELQKVANWKNNINVTEKEKMARAAYGVVSDAIDEATAAGAKEIGSSGLVEKLSRGKELFSGSKGAEKLLENKLAREQGNKLFGLTDAITGAGSLGYGGATGDWETAVGIMGAKKGLERFGPSTGAVLLDKIGQSIGYNPQLTNAITRRLIELQKNNKEGK